MSIFSKLDLNIRAKLHRRIHDPMSNIAFTALCTGQRKCDKFYAEASNK